VAAPPSSGWLRVAHDERRAGLVVGLDLVEPERVVILPGAGAPFGGGVPEPRDPLDDPPRDEPWRRGGRHEDAGADECEEEDHGARRRGDGAQRLDQPGAQPAARAMEVPEVGVEPRRARGDVPQPGRAEPCQADPEDDPTVRGPALAEEQHPAGDERRGGEQAEDAEQAAEQQRQVDADDPGRVEVQPEGRERGEDEQPRPPHIPELVAVTALTAAPLAPAIVARRGAGGRLAPLRGPGVGGLAGPALRGRALRGRALRGSGAAALASRCAPLRRRSGARHLRPPR
jgi:hypothetical protein